MKGTEEYKKVETVYKLKKKEIKLKAIKSENKLQVCPGLKKI